VTGGIFALNVNGRKAMKKYYLKYRPLTGLGAPVKTKWFDTIEERYQFFKSGVQVVGFGQIGG